ncbi:hypothetical protein HN789_07525 [archaeon]|jgi:hypothetical protein|nr:hypothetical protein [archaeon]MBT4272227.1 hypothetical protein [archaeon]MBT4460620.1 hypothetical protein [archaeon]MBT4857987.1 hypothetical protein [archaeon]MBT5424166.1 hypothetical protein [archaeon]
MKKLLIRFRNLIIKLKVYMARTTSYISLINSAMILFLFLSNLEKYNVDIDIRRWIVPLFFVGVIGMLTFGYLEYKFVYHQEQKTTQKKNPYLQEVIERLDRIEEQLKNK